MGRRASTVEPKICEHCSTPLARKRFGQRLEDVGVYNRRRFCNMECSGAARRKSSPTLAALRKRAEKFRGTHCDTCSATTDLQVHHIDSNPANNDMANLMTLCATCHTKWHWAHGKKPLPKRCLTAELTPSI